MKIACASTVAAVVPSPALSAVFFATSCTIFAPIAWNGSGRFTSFATDTPSLVTCGPPNDFSITTWRPAGPIVHLTASANRSTPFFISMRALSENMICFDDMVSSLGTGD